MSKKPRLSHLNKQIQEKTDTERKKPKLKKTAAEANPVRGERGDFLKVTITLPPNMLADLKRLGIEKKLCGKKDTDVSSLIRESIKAFLGSQE